MRILEAFGEPFSYGGQEAFVMNVLEHLDLPDASVDILTPYYCDNTEAAAWITARGGEVYSLGCRFSPGHLRAGAEWRIRRFLRDHPYDVIHIHSGSNSMLAMYARLADRAGIRNIIVHSHCTGRPGVKHAAAKILTAPELAMYPTSYCACSLEAGMWRFPRRICRRGLLVINNGIDIERFRYDPVIRARVRAELGMDDDTMLIGNVGRLTYQKNQDFLIELLSRIRDREHANGLSGRAMDNAGRASRYRLILIGDGEERSMLEARAMELGLSDDIIFTGSVSNVNEYLQAIDVAVMPSRYEGLAIAVIEAQAAGLEVIASEGIPEIAAITSSAVLLPLDDVDAWLRAVTEPHSRHPEQADEVERAGFGSFAAARKVRELYLRYV